MGKCFTTTFDKEKKTAVIQGKVSPDSEIVSLMIAQLLARGYQASYVMEPESLPRNLRGSRRSRDKAQVDQELRAIAQACNYDTSKK